MIHFFVGTKAQFIKLAPIMLALDQRQAPYRIIDSGQHAALTARLRDSFGISAPDSSISENKEDVATMRHGLGWLGAALLRCIFRPAWIRQHVFAGDSGICVIHGDTASTLLGTLFARRAGLRVAHVEAGLRSFNYFNPFPEELIRVICMRLCAVLFAPDETAMSNMDRMRLRGQKVFTHGNTGLDAVKIQEESGVSSGRERGSFVLATCHRLETLRSRRSMEGLVRCLSAASEQYPVVFVLHKPTRIALRKYGLLPSLEASVECLPMQDYFDFVALLRDAKCIMADGGSIQEECAALNVPLLILRSHSERQDGIGKTAELIGFDETKVKQFIKNLPSRSADDQKEHQTTSPSSIVAEHLMQLDAELTPADDCNQASRQDTRNRAWDTSESPTDSPWKSADPLARRIT